MKLQAVQIKKFRSIDDVCLEDIGDLNVLIGKNNSGKSNILLAIDSFFACIKGGDLVTPEPPIGTEIDFFGKNTDKAIEIELSFSMESAERDELKDDIISESPQLSNAAEAIDSQSWLTVSFRLISGSRRAAFISALALRNHSNPASSETKLLRVSDAAAHEILSKTVGVARTARQTSIIEDIPGRLDPDDWQRFKDFSKRGEPPIRMMMRRGPDLDAEWNERLEGIFRQSESLDDFRRSVVSFVTTSRQDAEKSRSEPLRNKLGTFSGEEAAVPKYIQNLIGRLSKIKVLYLRERRSPIGESEAKSLLSLKVERGGTQRLQSIQDTVSSLLGVRIDAFNSSSAKKEAEMDVDDFLAEVNGSGIREALRLVLDFEFQKPDIFLVEEPEIYLHPALEMSMMRYLKTISSLSQIFITTHSTNFLDTAEMKNVYLISKNDSTHVQKLNFEEAELQLPHELGIRLSSLFLFDRLVFVEGPSDEAVLREWAAKLHINLSQVGVGFVHMGGVHNFGYFAAEQTLSFLMKRKVKVWFMLDRDEKEEEEIKKLAVKCGVNAKLKVLQKRELENYLIQPRIIAEFIALKRRLAGDSDTLPPKESEVKTTIDEVAEKLKPFAIEKRVARTACKPVYPATKRLFDVGSPVGINGIIDEISRTIADLEASKAVVEKSYDEQSKAVEAKWSHEKLSLVQGDILLDRVCQMFNVRFRKEVDSSRAASLLHANEIDPEIQQLLKEIGSPTASAF